MANAENDGKFLVGADRGPLCSRCETYHAVGASCFVTGAFWWALAKQTSRGGGSWDPGADFALVHEIQSRFSDADMRRRAFREATLFRSRAPACGTAGYTSEHTAECDACIDHSMQALLRWEEDRK